MRQLLPPYEIDDTGAVDQPVRSIDLTSFLHPMRFDVDTLHDLLTEQIGVHADSDSVFAFAQRLAQLEPDWNAIRKDSVERSRNFLNDRLQPAEQTRWKTEIAALLDYLGQVDDPEKTVTSPVALQHFADLVRFVRSRGDSITLSTKPFGNEQEAFTKYPGLVGGHAYSVVDVRSAPDGGISLVLQNPQKDNPNVPQTIDGLSYGPDTAVILDAKHLTKFGRLSIRGTGTRFAFGDPVNDCAPRAFDYVAETTHSTQIRPITRTIGLDGISVDEFEHSANTPLQRFDNHTTIGNQLLGLGHEAAAVVVDAYTSTNRHGIGAHAYVLYNDNGTIWVRDRTIGPDHPLANHPTVTDIRAITAVLYTPDGRSHLAPQHDTTGAHTLGNTRIGAPTAPARPVTPEDFPADAGPGPGYLTDRRSQRLRKFVGLTDSASTAESSANQLRWLFEAEPATTANTVNPYASRRMYPSPTPPPTLGVGRADTIGDTHHTVLMAEDGRAVVIGPTDSITWNGHDSNGNTQIHVTSQPGMQYTVRTELLHQLDKVTGSNGVVTYTPLPDQHGRRPSQVLFYARSAVRLLRAGQVLATMPLGTGLRISGLHSPVVLPPNAVRALDLGGPAAAALTVMHAGPLFSTVNSRPAPRQSDAKPGTSADQRELMNNLGRIATRDPQGLVEMFHEYPDGTVGVRFYINGRPNWIRTDRRLLHDQSGSPMHAGHVDGDPMWAALIQKVYAMLRPDIWASDTVSVRPFGEPIHPPPVQPMPGTAIVAPADRLTIVDRVGGLLSIQPGDEVHGIDDPGDPALLSVWIGNDPAAPRHSVHRNLLAELTSSGPGGGGYHWHTPTTWQTPVEASNFLGLRRMSPGAPLHIPAGTPISLDVRIANRPVLDGSTRISVDALRDLGITIRRAYGKIFGLSGPVPYDAAQGELGDCYLFAPLKNISASNPGAIRDMISEYPDGTVAVRFFTERGFPKWVRVNRDFYTNAFGRMMYAVHDGTRALWPALVEKAYAVWRGGDYFRDIHGGHSGTAMMQLLLPYESDDAGAVDQPVRSIDLYTFLHPMRFGVDAVHDLLTEQIGAHADSDSVFAFARRLAQLEPAWNMHHSAGTEDFRNFLNYNLQPAEETRWQTEIAAVLDYLGQVEDPQKTLTSPVALQHFTDLVRFVRGRGDNITLSTRSFGNHRENITTYPGLVGNHAYSVVDVRSAADGGIKLVLENPLRDNPNVSQTIDGLSYGPGATVTVDARHLTKFVALSIRGTGTRFAFGDTPASVPNQWPQPETAPGAARIGMSARDGTFTSDGTASHPSIQHDTPTPSNDDRPAQVNDDDHLSEQQRSAAFADRLRPGRGTPEFDEFLPPADASRAARDTPAGNAFASLEIRSRQSTTTPAITRPDGTTVETTDGSTSHAPVRDDAPQARIGVTPPHSTIAPRNDCAPLTLAALRHRTNSTVVRLVATPTTLAGVARTEFEHAAGATLRSFRNHTEIAENLRALGHGHIALVVDGYTTTDEHGIGAHTYLLINDHGTITVDDRGFDVQHPFPPQLRRELARTEAILYTPHGIPIEHPDVPAPRWEALPHNGNQLFEAFARLHGHPTAQHARAALLHKIMANPNRSLQSFTHPRIVQRMKEEHQRRTGVNNDNQRGLLTPAQWNAETVRRQQFDQQLNQDRLTEFRNLVATLQNPLAPTDHVTDVLLPFAAQTLELNLIVLHPRHAREVFDHNGSGAPFTLLHVATDTPQHTQVAMSGDGTAYTIDPAHVDTPTGFTPPPGHAPYLPTPATTGGGPGIGHLNLDGIRVFDTDAAGLHFGETALDRWHELTPMQQHAVWAYDRNPIPNIALRNGENYFKTLVERFTDSSAAVQLLTELTKPRPPSLAELASWYQRGEAALRQAIPDPDRATATWRWLRTLFQSPAPNRLLSELMNHHGLAVRGRSVFKQYLGLPLHVDSVRSQIALMDQATRRPVPITEPIRLVRGLFEITFLRAADGNPLGDRDPELLEGTIQNEPGYMSTSVSRNPVTMPSGKQFTARIDLTLPVGGHGVWIGLRSAVPNATELLLARGTRYRITSVHRHPETGLVLLDGEILPPPDHTEQRIGLATDSPSTTNPESDLPTFVVTDESGTTQRVRPATPPDIPTINITDPSGTPQAHDAGEHHPEQSAGEHPASTQTYPAASHEPLAGSSPGGRTLTALADDPMDLDSGDLASLGESETIPATPAFEPEDGDTYFGEHLLEQLGSELPGSTATGRWQFTERGPAHPDPRLGAVHPDELTPEQREELLPIVPVPVEFPHPHEELNLITLVDHDGTVHLLPAEATVRATTAHGRSGRPFYNIVQPDGRRRMIPVALVEDFEFRPDRDGSDSGWLSWHYTETASEVRLLGYNEDGMPVAVDMPYETPLVAKPGQDSQQWIKAPGSSQWVSVTAPDHVLPDLPTLADRSADPLFGPDGQPKPHEARQGESSDCALLAVLKQRAEHDPQSITDMLHDHGNGIVSVRFHIDGRFEWVPVDKRIYVNPDTGIGHFVRHERGGPLWSTLIEKAYALRFGDGDGYYTLDDQATPTADVTARLGKGFYEARGATYEAWNTERNRMAPVEPQPLQQPVRDIDDEIFLHPLQFDANTLHDLVSHFMLSGRVSPDPTNDEMRANPEFAAELAETYDDWQRAKVAHRSRVWRTLHADAHDEAARSAAHNAFFEHLRTEGPDTPAGFHRYLNELLPGRYEAEKAALTEYFRVTQSGKQADRSLPEEFEVAAQAIGDRIDWALRRGTTVTLNTPVFGPEGEAAVPGLVDEHSYAVHAIERDRTGRPIRVLLENPWDHHPWAENGIYRIPANGIQHRLDPRGLDYTPDANGKLYRRIWHTDRDGNRDGTYTEYGLRGDGTQYLRNPDGTVVALTRDGVRYFQDLDGMQHVAFPDGRRQWRTRDRTQFRTDKNGRKEVLRPGDPTWRPDPTRTDPPVMTIPRRGGIIAVDLTHLPKFRSIGMGGPGAHGLFGPDHPAATGPNPRAADRSTAAPPADTPAPRALPTRWQPVPESHDPLFSALAQAWRLPSAEYLRQRIRESVYRTEMEHRELDADIDELRSRRRIDSAQWFRHHRRGRRLGPWLENSRRLMSSYDLTDELNSADPEVAAAPLQLAADVLRGNVVLTHPDGRISEVVGEPAQPTVFIRRGSDGHYEVGVTAEGAAFTAPSGPPRAPRLYSADEWVPPDRIPPPLRRMLASPQMPLLHGEAVTRDKIGEHVLVDYLEPEELEELRLFIGPGSRLFRVADGLPFDTEVAGRRAAFAMDEFGNLYAGFKNADIRAHSSFFGGRIVTAAGEIAAIDGRGSPSGTTPAAITCHAPRSTITRWRGCDSRVWRSRTPSSWPTSPTIRAKDSASWTASAPRSRTGRSCSMPRKRR